MKLRPTGNEQKMIQELFGSLPTSTTIHKVAEVSEKILKKVHEKDFSKNVIKDFFKHFRRSE
jgi:hypothetical protein